MIKGIKINGGLIMDTVDELRCYCEEENTFGALMLTGEWGCGKTYLIDNLLPSRLNDKFVIIRISLFGISSINNIHEEIEKAYLQKLIVLGASLLPNTPKDSIEKLINGKFGKIINGMKDLASFVPQLEKIMSISPSKFISVDPKIGDIQVVLVFDDLERCLVNEALVLGCINEYCENKHFKTILIANENILNNKTDKDTKDDILNYREIKEKLISQTVKYVPDYDEIISNIIDNYKTSNENYKVFLENQKKLLVHILNIGMSKNLRSIKCSIQSFERLYDVLSKQIKEKDINKFFSSFVTFSQMYKEGKIKKDEKYGYLMENIKIENQYPSLFDVHYMLDSIENWVVDSIWNKDLFINEVNHFAERYKITEPKDVLRYTDLLHLDETIVNAGFSGYIEMAYSAKLSLDEYINLFTNIIIARKISYSFPCEVNMDKIKAAVQTIIDNLVQSETIERSRSFLLQESIDMLEPKEQEIYFMIDNFRNNEVQIYEHNKRRYIEALNRNDISLMYELSSKRYKSFDKEIREAILRCFDHLKNDSRSSFIMAFKDTWCGKIRIDDKSELAALKVSLEERSKRFDEDDKRITLCLYNKFLETLSEMENEIIE